MQEGLDLPIQLGQEWTETVGLGNNRYYSKWNLKTAIRPVKWIFLQTNGIGEPHNSYRQPWVRTLQ